MTTSTVFQASATASVNSPDTWVIWGLALFQVVVTSITIYLLARAANWANVRGYRVGRMIMLVVGWCFVLVLAFPVVMMFLVQFRGIVPAGAFCKVWLPVVGNILSVAAGTWILLVKVEKLGKSRPGKKGS
jgi:hypothetical protein